jgi:hypothetical protein
MTESMATKTKEAHFIMRGRAMHCLLCGLPELPASVECLVPPIESAHAYIQMIWT